MIDIHTHILPACDDGSPDIETSIEFIKKMTDAGVTSIVLTPHFIRNSYHNTSDIIENKFELLQKAIKAENIDIDLYTGPEVYLDIYSKDTIISENFTINNTKYVLVETNLTGFPNNLFEILYELVNSGLYPILAHPERYSNIINDPGSAEEFIYKNIYLQLNAGSILGHYGKKIQKAAWFLIENGFVHFLASDCHCRNSEYSLPKAIDVIRKHIDDYTVRLLTEINPSKMLNNEKIEFFYLDKIENKSKGFFSRFFK